MEIINIPDFYERNKIPVDEYVYRLTGIRERVPASIIEVAIRRNVLYWRNNREAMFICEESKAESGDYPYAICECGNAEMTVHLGRYSLIGRCTMCGKEGTVVDYD